MDQFEFSQPQIIKAITVVGGGEKGFFTGDLKDTRSLQISDDGTNFRWICFIPAGDVVQQTIDIPVTTARYFRVTFKNDMVPSDKPGGTDIAEIVLHTVFWINMFEQKGGFSASSGFPGNSTPATDEVINESDIIRLIRKDNCSGC